ncbi:MAG: putative collagen-binding domain-containing protein [Bacteroidota bacterium]
MDEIGFWHTGVMPDEVNPKHDTMRHEVLWGSLMAGAAGVEWYFGAHYPHNDLACEDWRSRENMWKQTDYAISFFQEYLPYWEMKPMDDLLNVEDAYCLAQKDKVYAVYFPIGSSSIRKIDLGDREGNYIVKWYNPRTGGDLIEGTVAEIKGQSWQSIGLPQTEVDQDWVALVSKK